MKAEKQRTVGNLEICISKVIKASIRYVFKTNFAPAVVLMSLCGICLS